MNEPSDETAPSAVPLKQAHILLVEDSAADIRLTHEALAEAGITNPIDVVTNGEAALAYVRGQPPYEDRTPPDVILLDLNLPRLDGRAVLQALKTDPKTLSIPIIVLTTSSSQADVKASYAQHANGFVTKPMRFDDLARALIDLRSFWLQLVTLPAPEDRAVGDDRPAAP